MARIVSNRGLQICGALAFCLLVRLCIGLHGYSGRGDAPKFGDYEAQRHWMEITTNLPPRDWYQETADNDLSYWGLDYPPLSAYQSWICGKLIGWLEPEAMQLHASRGYETKLSKLWMRLSVIAFDIAVFAPCVAAAVLVSSQSPKTVSLSVSKLQGAVLSLPLFASLLQPAAMLIDHGHFQYNSISLGLSAGAAAAIIAGRQLFGSFLFCCALNHKQMTLYFAPAFFAHLLGQCLQKPGVNKKILAVAKLGIVVILSFAVLWAPYLGSLTDLKAVIQRLAPLQRGLFEDYVANFWCVSSLVVKWKHLLSQQALVRLTTGATLLALAPSMVQQISRPSSKGLLYSMAVSGLAFFLFSYQVHEKSILMPLTAILLLADQEPFLAKWMPVVASFSMFPLLRKDENCISYAACLLLWVAFIAGQQQWLDTDTAGYRTAGSSQSKSPEISTATDFAGDEAVSGPEKNSEQLNILRVEKGLQAEHAPPFAAANAPQKSAVLDALPSTDTKGLGKQIVQAVVVLSVLAGVSIHTAAAFIPPPGKLRYLYDAMFVTLSSLHIGACFLYLNYRQWTL